jgi:hypothetical protein
MSQMILIALQAIAINLERIANVLEGRSKQ